VPQVGELALSPDGSKLLVATPKSFALIDIAAKKRVRTFDGHTDKIMCLSFSPDQSRIARFTSDASELISCGLDQHIFLSKCRTPTDSAWLEGGWNLRNHKLKFSQDSTMYLGQLGKTKKAWDVTSGLRVDRPDPWPDMEKLKWDKSPDKRWNMVGGKAISIVDRTFAELPKEKDYRKNKSRPSIRWHYQSAGLNETIRNRDSYKALFHLSCMVRGLKEPPNVLHDEFQRVLSLVKEDYANRDISLKEHLSPLIFEAAKKIDVDIESP